MIRKVSIIISIQTQKIINNNNNPDYNIDKHNLLKKKTSYN